MMGLKELCRLYVFIAVVVCASRVYMKTPSRRSVVAYSPALCLPTAFVSGMDRNSTTIIFWSCRRRSHSEHTAKWDGPRHRRCPRGQASPPVNCRGQTRLAGPNAGTRFHKTRHWPSVPPVRSTARFDWSESALHGERRSMGEQRGVGSASSEEGPGSGSGTSTATAFREHMLNPIGPHARMTCCQPTWAVYATELYDLSFFSAPFPLLFVAPGE